MENITLAFAAPSTLDSTKVSTRVPKVSWHYGTTDNTLELNVNNWRITSSGGDKSGHITQWLVSESQASMVLPGDGEGDYKNIDLPFAMSMLGQLVGREDLIKYLQQLQIEFERMKPSTDWSKGEETTETPEENENDTINNPS